MLVLWSICLGAFTCNHHITRFSILGQRRRGYFGQPLCGFGELQFARYP